MAEYKEDFNQTILRAARGNKATAIGRALFGKSQEKKDEQEQQA